jgi:hypothetical protein
MNWYCFDSASGDFDGDHEIHDFCFAVAAMLKPKTLAKLLSHPGCLGVERGSRREPREFMLQRFEELLFHNGEPVYLKPEVSDESTSANAQTSPPPPRGFHNLHDAAAWIQQNWPDFDLETNHPVKWRSQRE